MASKVSSKQEECPRAAQEQLLRERFPNSFLTLDDGFSAAAKAAIEEDSKHALEIDNYADCLTFRLTMFLETLPDLIGVQVTGEDKYSVNVIAFFYGAKKYVFRIYDVCIDGSVVEVFNKSYAVFRPDSGAKQVFHGEHAHQLARFAAHQHILNLPLQPRGFEEPYIEGELEDDIEEIEREIELQEIETELEYIQRELEYIQRELEEIEQEPEEPEEYEFSFCDLGLFVYAHGKFMELRRRRLAKVPKAMRGALPYLPPRRQTIERDAFDALSYAGVVDLDLMEIVHRIDQVFLEDDRMRMMRVAAYYRAVRHEKAVSAYFALFANMSRMMFRLLRP